MQCCIRREKRRWLTYSWLQKQNMTSRWEKESSLQKKSGKQNLFLWHVAAVIPPLELFAFLGQTLSSFFCWYCYPAARSQRQFTYSCFLLLPLDEFQSFVEKLPTHYAVNTSVVEHLWRMDASLSQRYRQLETSSDQLLTKARRTANKLFSLSKRCRKQPKVVLQRPR